MSAINRVQGSCWQQQNEKVKNRAEARPEIGGSWLILKDMGSYCWILGT